MSRSLGLLMLAAAVVLGASAVWAVERTGLEAAIVYNMLQFVEWPGESSIVAGTGLVVCLDQGSPLLHDLQSLEGHPVRNWKLSVKGVTPSEGIRSCNAIYVDSDAARRAAASRTSATTPSALLTIAGSRYPRAEGLAIRLSEVAGRIVFEIDMKEARSAGLLVSSRLLRLASRVIE